MSFYDPFERIGGSVKENYGVEKTKKGRRGGGEGT